MPLSNMKKLKPSLDLILEQFTEHYLLPKITTESSRELASELFPKAFEYLLESIIDNDDAMIDTAVGELTQINLEYHIPYIVLVNELSLIKGQITHLLLENGEQEAIVPFCQKFDRLENNIAKVYLDEYLRTLQSNNRIRLISLNELVEKNVIVYYEAHIKWLSQLAVAIEENSLTKMPEPDPTECTFGKWLHSEAKSIISNNSKFQELHKLHTTLHYISTNIAKLIESDAKQYHALMTYLEKAELSSLEIGTELALFDNKMMVAKAVKDSLTGVLNRSLLDQLFINQYELAQATDSSFVIAMCDLDHFKLINDTYGHVIGDQVLKSFANLLKKELRNSDFIVRYGGEEFILILPATTLQNSKEVIEAIRRKFQQSTIAYEETTVKATVSIGMCEVNPKEKSKTELPLLHYYLKRADAKLYDAKKAGRNRIIV